MAKESVKGMLGEGGEKGGKVGKGGSKGERKPKECIPLKNTIPKAAVG